MVRPVRFSLLIILSYLSLGIAYPTNDDHDKALLADAPSLDEYVRILLPEATSEADDEQSPPSDTEETPQSDTEEEAPPKAQDPATSEAKNPGLLETEKSAPSADEEPVQSDPGETLSEESAGSQPKTPGQLHDEAPVQLDSEDLTPSEDDGQVPTRGEERANEGNDDASAGKPPLTAMRMGPDMDDADAQTSDEVEDTLDYPTGVAQQTVSHIRIVGGEVARDRAEFAYQASFRFRSQNDHFCGATIIDSTHLLTAAHCVVDNNGYVVSARTLKVVVGDLNIRHPSETTISRNVLNIWTHPKYSMTTTQNDVAVLRVADLGNFTEYVNHVEIATKTPAAGTMCVVSGWGTTSSGGIISEDLKFVKVPIVDRRTCVGSYGSLIYDGMLCAGFMEGGKDACQGDSGGPLVCDGKLAGVVSWGYSCAVKNYPGIYADVAVYADWIRKQQGKSSSTTYSKLNCFVVVVLNILVLTFIMH